MKKCLIFLSLLLTLFACENNDGSDKVKLDYGSLIDDGITYISKDELDIKMLDEDSFILAIYPGADSLCGCWTVFRENLNRYVQEEERIVYGVDAFSLMGEESYGITLADDRPNLALIEKGKLKHQWLYDTKNTQQFYTSYIYLSEHFEKYTIAPNTIYIDQDTLDSFITNSYTFAIAYTWHSCSDCKYCFPNVVLPFFEKEDEAKKLYIIDLEVDGLLLVDGVKDNKNKNYVAFLNEYGLTSESNETFGYETGFVPTFQYYRDGELFDACVYFNDKVEQIDGVYKITRSYYTSERITQLPFLANSSIENKVLLDQTISEDELNITPESVSFKKEAASIYHDPLLNLFLSTYLL